VLNVMVLFAATDILNISPTGVVLRAGLFKELSRMNRFSIDPDRMQHTYL
jgi:hypothetical protein